MHPPAAQKPILMCASPHETEIAESETKTIARSPLACLNAATSANFGLIVVCFSSRLISDRNIFMELCACLKINPRTLDTPLLVFLNSPQREMIERMRDHGVDFVIIGRLEAQNETDWQAWVRGPGAEAARIDRMLSALCPHMNYMPIDNRSELITCQACRNRMVLGGRRLHGVCESSGHLHCPYFLETRTHP